MLGFPPFLIPALQKIGILHYIKAKLRKHLQQSVRLKEIVIFGWVDLNGHLEECQWHASAAASTAQIICKWV